MARRSRKPFQLGLDPTVYNAQAIQTVTDADLKREYSRLRREANDRLRGFARSSEFSNAAIAMMHYDIFSPIKGLSRPELEALTIRAQRFVTAEGSSVSGQREIRRKAISSLHASGYGFINTKNYGQWGKFMEWFRGASGASGYHYVKRGDDPGEIVSDDAGTLDSDEVRDLFEQWSISNGYGRI